MVSVGIVILWLAFAATHMSLSSLGLRPRLVARLGEQGFQGVYSLVALGIFVPLVWLYFANQHAGPPLWYLGHYTLVRWLAYLAMVLSLTLLVGGFLTPSPASIAAPGGKAELRGVLRITRHPVLMSIGIFGAVHLLTANLNLAELVFFAGFPIFAVVGCHHQDQRKRVGDEAFERFVSETSFLPFGRPGALQGLREAWLAVGISVVLVVLLRYFHPSWFGGAP